MRTLISFLALISFISFFGCAASTKYSKSELRPVETLIIKGGDTTRVIKNELVKVSELETKEKTLLGTSRTTVRDMTHGEEDLGRADESHANAYATRSGADNITALTNSTSRKIDAMDPELFTWMVSKNGYPPVRMTMAQAKGIFAKYGITYYPNNNNFFWQRQYWNYTDLGRIEARLQIPWGTLPRPYRMPGQY